MKSMEDTIYDNLKTKPNCILNLNGIDLDTPVYRVYSINYLMELFNSKYNVLVKPKKWDDPFENLVFQQKATLSDGTSVSFDPIRNRFYGQCWTLSQNETDALWRIYSHDKDGVRVKTTLRKLFDNFYDTSNIYAAVSFFLGKIIYESNESITKELESSDYLSKVLNDVSGRSMVQTLLVKRKEFEHENEVRLIYFSSEDSVMDIYRYSFDPNSIFEDILFDPRFETDEIEKKKGEIRNHGFKGTITKSELYQIPRMNLVLSKRHYPY